MPRLIGILMLPPHSIDDVGSLMSYAFRGSITRLALSLSTLRGMGCPTAARKTRFRLVAGLCRAGLSPAGSALKGFSDGYVIRPPFPGLPWRNDVRLLHRAAPPLRGRGLPAHRRRPGLARAPDPARHARRREAPPHRHRQARPAPHPRQPGRRPRAGHPLVEAPGRGARGGARRPVPMRRLSSGSCPSPRPSLLPRRASDLAPTGLPAPPSSSVQTQQLPRRPRGATPLPRPSRAWVGT